MLSTGIRFVGTSVERSISSIRRTTSRSPSSGVFVYVRPSTLYWISAGLKVTCFRSCPVPASISDWNTRSMLFLFSNEPHSGQAKTSLTLPLARSSASSRNTISLVHSGQENTSLQTV